MKSLGKEYRIRPEKGAGAPPQSMVCLLPWKEESARQMCRDERNMVNYVQLLQYCTDYFSGQKDMLKCIPWKFKKMRKKKRNGGFWPNFNNRRKIYFIYCIDSSIPRLPTAFQLLNLILLNSHFIWPFYSFWCCWSLSRNLPILWLQ